MTCPKTKLNIMQFCVIYSKNDQDIVQVINLFNSQSSDKLHDLIFKMKAQSGGGHELSEFSAYEIAISRGSNVCVAHFLEHAKENDCDAETLKLICQNDRGSTLELLILMKAFPISETEKSALDLAFDYKAKHTIRFLLAMDTVLETVFQENLF